MSQPGIRLFQDDVDAQSFRLLCPEQKENTFSLTEMVTHLSDRPLQTSQERETQLTALADPKDQRKVAAFLFTIERLRECLVLGHDDVDYCFSHLPQTPKHQTLQSLFHQYLDSDLAFDWTAQVWSLTEKLKQLDQSPFPQGVQCYWGEHPNFLFGEFSKALTGSADGLKETWQTDPAPEKPPNQRTAIYQSARLSLIERLVDRTEHWLNRGTERIVIPFGADNSACEMLKARLAHKNISFVRSEQTDACARTISFLEKLRQYPALPLQTRLKLNATILSQSFTSLPIEDDQVLRFLDKGDLTREQIEEISQHERCPSQNDKHASDKPAAVVICPFRPVLAVAGTRVLAYVEDAFFQTSRYPFCLEDSEIDHLHFHGFSLPRSRDLKARREHFLGQIQKAHWQRVELFSALPSLEEKKTTRFFRLRTNETTLAHSNESAEPSMHVRLPMPTLSATQLETFSQCPAKYFYSHRLRINESRFFWEDHFALTFGNTVHETLEKYFSPENDSRPLNLGKIESLFEQSLKERNINAIAPLKAALWGRFRPMLGYIERIETQLQQTFPQANPLAVEHSFQIQKEGYKLKGKIDRVDRQRDGSVLVLDYKTGTVNFSPNHLQKGTHFQALIYLLAAEQMASHVQGVLFYDLKKGELRRGLVRDEHIAKDAKKKFTRGHCIPSEAFDTIKEAGWNKVKELAAQIESGQFLTKAESNLCSYCPYPTHCRNGYSHV